MFKNTAPTGLIIISLIAVLLFTILHGYGMAQDIIFLKSFGFVGNLLTVTWSCNIAFKKGLEKQKS